MCFTTVIPHRNVLYLYLSHDIWKYEYMANRNICTLPQLWPGIPVNMRITPFTECIIVFATSHRLSLVDGYSCGIHGMYMYFMTKLGVIHIYIYIYICIYIYIYTCIHVYILWAHGIHGS